MDLNVLTLRQPYASLLSLGRISHAVFDRRTTFRGPAAIHASEAWDEWTAEFVRSAELSLARLALPPVGRWPRGVVLAVADLVDCQPTELYEPAGDFDREFGDWTPCRWAWVFANVRPLRVKPRLSGDWYLRKFPYEFRKSIMAEADAAAV